ncbi:hypothetical protein AGMMS49938_04810 [Fibrobacterales bacterium]|nr:hypothetical protein AGMMS49938_04810 [Fibrobacterales bacterium]
MKFQKILLPISGIAVLLFLLSFFLPSKGGFGNAILEIDEPNFSDYEQVEQKDSTLAAAIKTLLNRYHPPNAFILLMDANGEILSWGQRENDQASDEPTFLKRDSFPAASLAKIATAAAALESGKTPTAEVPKIGRNSTLYKRQINPPENHKGEFITLENAFAKSNNPAMGIFGMKLGKEKLQKAAEKLGFTNFNYPDSGFALAESACGFTQRNTLSPLQAANAVRKFLSGSSETKNGGAGGNFKKQTNEGMRQLFLKTVSDGTAKTAIRKSVYSYNRNAYDIGGKTGSLDGEFPMGRYDWFAGFAQSKTDQKKSLIIVVMQVHGKFRNQKSSTIAGMLINEWAKSATK